MKQIVYRYKLCKDYEGDSIQIAGINLSKSFKDFPNKQEQLEMFLRTNTNLDGFIDFEEKDLISGIVVDKSLFEGPNKKYNPIELTFFNRDQLVEIAQSYNIDPRNKRNDFLIKLMIVEQEKIAELKKKTKKKGKYNADTGTDN
jgi:hypothetical protein